MSVYLLDAPLMMFPEARSAKIREMAKVIATAGVIGDRTDAIRTLRNAGFSAVEVHVLVDESRALAFQDFVAEQMQDLVTREMAKP